MNEPKVHEELENDYSIVEKYYVVCESINELLPKDNINRIISTTPYSSKNYKSDMYYTYEEKWWFSGLDDNDNQFQAIFCNKCGNYIFFNYMENASKKCLCLCNTNI